MTKGGTMRDGHDSSAKVDDQADEDAAALADADMAAAAAEATQHHGEDDDPLTLDGDFDAEDFATGDN